jgi:ABC-type methionine transport system ATPase subunit
MKGEKMGEVKVELFIPGELKDEPIICDMIKNYKISLKIVEASFSTESGWAFLILTGEKIEIEKVFDFLRQKGIKVELKEK